MNKDSLFKDGICLTPQDLIRYEHTLKDLIYDFLPFDSYSLYFPKPVAGKAQQPLVTRYNLEEKHLMLPLKLQGRDLCYFIARGVNIKAPKTAPQYLEALATSALEKILLYKTSITDSLTGMATREHFMVKLVKELDLIQNCMMPAPGGCKDPGIPTFSGSVGVVVLDLDNFQRINDRYGYTLGDSIVAEVGKAVSEAAFESVVCARLFEDKFAFLIPDGRPKVCAQLAEKMRLIVERIPVEDPVTGDILKISTSAGFANYPQSLSGPHFKRSATEQGRILMRKAAKAVATAKDSGRNCVFAYSDILQKGGKVLEVLPLQRLALSIGQSVDTREGGRFLVWSPDFQSGAQAKLTEDERISGTYPTMYKAEVVVIEVQEEIAFAEILHLSDTAWPVTAGDRLTLLDEKDSFFDAQAGPESSATPQRDIVTGLFRYKEFIGRYSRLRQNMDNFSVAVLRLAAGPADQGGNFQKLTDAEVQKVASRAENVFEVSHTGGRYSLNSLIYFFPKQDSDFVMEMILKLVRECETDFDIGLSAGLASFPFLNYRRSEILDNCRKGLDHAMMMEKPMVAQFDSVSLNIAADRLYVDGDIYGAVEEFRLALLADPDNILARNSLGICYAQLGKPEQARKQFEQVLEITPSNIMALYNLGWACQMLGNRETARDAYERCLELEPGNVFSLVRLGVLAEQDLGLDEAEQFYLKASELKGGDSLTMRHLARIAYARQDMEKAREYLHLALNANHNDAYAMNLLARLYLESGEDPQIAEVLARQSAALKPGKEEFWETLAMALEVQGKNTEAEQVRSRL
ncbi:diguanylate cyclase (GGDEF) domain-containing protein [Maridesulfovibrio ferrireducens]|uniref:diguanylate cyclase n=1 Tax=Maridesulfovibrio ferrireducens TaxID=246191 RepID=A0A1G9GVL8_9BACT|nr:GGDEF domain-containing protein [Maridesulfovibrio ferrireducens]SDL04698.1 diguanylate cyclase (GGDEF) domain-containing protein [Maridesulfovibrio ferrireducens]